MSRTIRHLLVTAALATVTATPVAALAQSSPKDALKAATDRINAIKAATGAKPIVQRVPPGDPCTAVTPAAVQGAFPGAQPGVRSKRLESDFGISECQWSDGGGQILLVLQESYTPARARRTTRTA